MVDTKTYMLAGQSVAARKLPAGLYVVATPIGNLADITLRALEVLAGADVIACEDTRTSAVLLRRYGIDRQRVSYNEHNADMRGDELIRRMEAGEAVALISDAGTPLVSDPGTRLVHQAVEAGITVTPLPGASAPLAALVGSGLAADSFRFCGFLPAKQQARRTRLGEIANDPATVMFFEGPSRITATLVDMEAVLGNARPIVIARELTKMHETFHRGTAAELLSEFQAMDRVRGEIVIVIAPAAPDELSESAVDDLLRQALKTERTKQAAKSVSEKTGLSAQHLYTRALALKDG